MSDDKFDQYEYPNEELDYQEEVAHAYDDEPAESDTTKKGVQKLLEAIKQKWKKNPRVFIVVGVVVVIVIVFYATRPSSPVQTIPNSNVNASQPAATSASMANAEQFNTEQTQDSQQEMKALDALKSSVSDRASEITNVQMQLQALQSTVSDLKDSQQSLLATVADLNKSVNQLHQSLTAEHQKEKKAKEAAPIIYHIRAIVPGRAWIVDQNGNARSVAVGDKLPQYGKIVHILADRGVVATSSGKVIEFNQNEF